MHENGMSALKMISLPWLVISKLTKYVLERNGSIIYYQIEANDKRCIVYTIHVYIK